MEVQLQAALITAGADAQQDDAFDALRAARDEDGHEDEGEAPSGP